MSYSHRDCDKCNSKQLKRIMKGLRKEGLTFSWTPDGETRIMKRWWPFKGTKLQQREVKIAMPPEMMPHGVYRWKTIEVRNNKQAVVA